MNSNNTTNNINAFLSNNTTENQISIQQDTQPQAVVEEDKKPSSSSVHQEFVQLIEYAHINDLDSLLDANGNLNTKKEAIEAFFPLTVEESIKLLLPYSDSIKMLNDNKLINQDVREAIENIRVAINSSVELIDSCGEVANNVCNYFLGSRGAELKPVKENLESFYTLTDNPDEMFAIVKSLISAKDPLLIRIEILRPEKNKEVSTHSYCLYVWEEVSTNENEKYVVYQAYFGGYTLVEWFKDPKFSIQAVDFHHYIKRLSELLSENENIRKSAYGNLFRLSGTESEVPSKKLMKVMYKPATVDTLVALNILKQLKNQMIELKEHINQEEKMTPKEYLKKICWNSVEHLLIKEFKENSNKGNEVKLLLEKLHNIKEVVRLETVEALQREQLFLNQNNSEIDRQGVSRTLR
jgi:NADH:ubiquinone oxidoreductase subunit C